MGKTAEELKKENNNDINTNTINTAPQHINRSSQDIQLGPVRRHDDINQINQINAGPINQHRSRVTGSQLSSLTMFRDAVVINDNREEVGQLNLPEIPELGDIKRAREKTDFTFSDSPRERNRILEESKKKRRMTVLARDQGRSKGDVAHWRKACDTADRGGGLVGRCGRDSDRDIA